MRAFAPEATFASDVGLPRNSSLWASPPEKLGQNAQVTGARSARFLGSYDGRELTALLSLASRHGDAGALDAIAQTPKQAFFGVGVHQIVHQLLSLSRTGNVALRSQIILQSR
jgi:hypothetical protein